MKRVLILAGLTLLAGSPIDAQTPSGAPVETRPPWQLPADQFVQVMGHRLHYYEKGTGPVILLVHGGSGSAALEWGRVIDQLAVGHRVIALHQIGFAPSEQPQISYDTATFIDHLGGFIRALDLSRVTLVGESFGGWVVASYAILAAEPGSTLPAIDQLVIVDGAITAFMKAVGGPPSGNPLFDPTARVEAGEYAKQHPLLNNPAMLMPMVQNTGMSKGEPKAVALASIHVPTLVIWGEKDELVPLEVGENVTHAISGAHLVVVPGSGHVPSIEKPVEFVRALTSFVDGK